MLTQHLVSYRNSDWRKIAFCGVEDIRDIKKINSYNASLKDVFKTSLRLLLDIRAVCEESY